MTNSSSKASAARTDGDNGGPAPPRATRAYHKKSRTGCLTCKTRRKRCDEGKPSCQRCIDSGWKCEGYAAIPKQKPISQHGFLPAASKSSPESDSSITILPTRQKLPLWPAKHRAHEDDQNHDMSILKGGAAAGTSTALITTKAAVLAPHLQLVDLALPWRSPDEIRSYRFFLEQAAPSFANSFDGEFWLGEIPRACHADPAIWHSVVSLGSVFEIYLETMRAGQKGTSQLANPKYRFALQQFNTAIQTIVSTPQSVTATTPWRTLTVSVLFTYICAIQGLHAQSRVHLTAAFNILRELDKGDISCPSPQLALPRPPPALTSAGTQPPRDMPSDSPISLSPLRAMISTLSIHSSSLDHGNLSHAAEMFDISDIYGMWRYYKLPSPSSHTRGSYGAATREGLYNATRACFSAMNGLLVVQTDNIPDILMLIMTGDPAALDRINAIEEPIYQCHLQIATALRRFQRELDIDDDDWSINETSTRTRSIPRSLLKSYYTLRMCHLANGIMFCRNRWAEGAVESPGKFVPTYMALMNLAERILTMKPLDPFDPPIPGPNTNTALCMVSFDGYPRSIRMKAIGLLRKYPRREGLWDSAFGAALAELTIERERTAREERLAREGVDVDGLSPDSSSGADDEMDPVAVEYHKPSILDRMFKSSVEYKGERRAKVYFATVYEVWNGITGQYFDVEW